MKPVEIILEVTNYCNLRCRYCHIHGKGAGFSRPKGYMVPELWKDILRELSQWTDPVNLVTHGAGEPLLYPDLKELLLEAKKLPHLTVGFMTNGMFLSEEMANFLVENQIDWLAFSVDGTIPSTHDKIRINSSLERVEKNIRKLVEIKNKTGSQRPLLHFNMVAYPEIQDQKDSYIERWLPFASSISISKFRPVNSKRLWNEAAPVKFIPCTHLFKQAVVGWDGRMGLCCEDINIKVSPGNLNSSSLEEIFGNSPVFEKYREKHQKGQIDELVLCRHCHIWASSVCLHQRDFNVGGYSIHMKSSPASELYEIKRM